MVARDGVEPFRVLCYQQVADSTIRAIRTLRSDCKSCVHFVCSRYRSNLPSHTRCAWLSLQISGVSVRRNSCLVADAGKRPEWTALTSGMGYFSVQMVTLDQVR